MENVLIKKEQTQAKILSSAWQLFLQDGYEQTSTRDIAKAAKVANGTVFSHYPNKISLLKAGLESQLDEILKKAQKADKTKDAKARMCHYAEFLFAFYMSQKEFSRTLFKEIMWQQEELTAQLNTFKAGLIHDNDASMLHAEVIVDIYFMTLLEGLNQASSTPESMLQRLSDKLSLINQCK